MTWLRFPLALSLLSVAACAAGSSSGTSSAGGGGSGGAATGGDSVGGGLLGGSGGGPGGGGSSACLSDTFEAEVEPANLLFQIDVSGSMNCAPEDSGCGVADPTPGSRWEVFKTQLTGALDTLPETSSVGLMHYPTGKGTFSGDPTGCVPQTADVPLAPLSTSKPLVTAELAQIVPQGGTPTHDAVTAALAQLEQAAGTGAGFLVLATDGQATFCAGCDLFCTSDELAADNEILVQEVAAAASMGIRTFVLGAPGSEAYRGILSRVAAAGQTSVSPGCSDAGPTYCHYDMTTAPDFGAALSDALLAVGSKALSCVYDIPPQDGTFDPTLVNVQLSSGSDTQTIPKDTSHQAGWDYSADQQQVILYGAACDEAKAALNGSITILYGCPTEVAK